MFRIIIKILLLCIYNTTLFGQNDSIKVASINSYIHQIDTTREKVDSFRFNIDSIEVKGIKHGNKIVAINLFQKSKTTLTITLYLKDKKLIFAKIVEPSKVYEKMYRFSDLYFENNNVFFSRRRTTRQLGLVIEVDRQISTNEYNKNLSLKFLQDYVVTLYSRL